MLCPYKRLSTSLELMSARKCRGSGDSVGALILCERCNHGVVHDDDRRSLRRQTGELRCKPLELRLVHAALVGAVRADIDRIEHNEAAALVVEAVVGFAEALLVQALAIHWIGNRDGVGRVDREDVMVPEGVVDLQAEILFRFAVKVVQLHRTLFRDLVRVEDVVAAVDGKVSFYATGMLERHVRSRGSIQFRLKMSVGKKEEGKRLKGRLRDWKRRKQRRRYAEGRTGRGGHGQKSAASSRSSHLAMINRCVRGNGMA